MTRPQRPGSSLSYRTRVAAAARPGPGYESRRDLSRDNHCDTAWPLGQVGPETVTGPASMIRACRCPPRLAGRRRTTGVLSDSDEGPGAGGDGAASRRAMLRPFSRCRERQRNRFYTALVACARILQKFLSKILAAACHHSPRPESLAAARRHFGAMARLAVPV